MAPEEFALPKETWREVISRRQRYIEIHAKLTNGEVREINDLITYNLDIRQFTQDVIERCEGSDLLRAFWESIQSVTVLDPTCGSGAFLFAALNILEPLYQTCLERMEAFVADLDRTGKKSRIKQFQDFRNIHNNIAGHPNTRYFILKSIILNNLFGVDIMEEAVEICKLRLFLKLVAQVDPNLVHENLGIEPLPDIDFNIRAGNTLVGYATYKEVLASAEGDWIRLQELECVQRKAEDLQQYLNMFRAVQVQTDSSDSLKDKIQLRLYLEELKSELNLQLAKEYGVGPDEVRAYEKWQKSHEPFHWFIEYYGIMTNGGFDVIIGNPPYIELREVKDYKTISYLCESCGNLYPLVLERCGVLAKENARQGYIVPVSSISTDRYEALQNHLSQFNHHFSNFDDRPSRLFYGLEHIRLTIHILGVRSKDPNVFSTRYHKWFADERDNLFHLIAYTIPSKTFMPKSFTKFGNTIEDTIAKKVQGQKKTLTRFTEKQGRSNIYYSRKVGYFLQVLNFIPKVLNSSGESRLPSEFKQLNFSNNEYATLVLGILNSSLFYWYVTVVSDCRHLNVREVQSFPINVDALRDSKHAMPIIEIASSLMRDIKANSEMKTMNYKDDVLHIQHIYPKTSKGILDKLDQHIGRYFGMSEEEIDYIINYEIKYRVG